MKPMDTAVQTTVGDIPYNKDTGNCDKGCAHGYYNFFWSQSKQRGVFNTMWNNIRLSLYHFY